MFKRIKDKIVSWAFWLLFTIYLLFWKLRTKYGTVSIVKDKILYPRSRKIPKPIEDSELTENGTEAAGLAIDYSDNDLTETVLELAEDGVTEIEIEQVLQSQFNANIQALLNSSSGEILSKPSVMVMDGRQARIQIGQHIPITRTTSGTSYTSEDIEYVPTGIILNIRPRISSNNDEILMQVETIITDPQNLSYNSDGILITPIINNRKVETFIRVENNNPFII